MVADNLEELLAGMREGQSGALEKFTTAVYPALTRIARSLMLAERNGHTLTTRDLTHTLIERLLIEPSAPAIESPRAFFVSFRQACAQPPEL